MLSSQHAAAQTAPVNISSSVDVGTQNESSQAAGGTPIRDPQAIALVQQSISVMGGATALQGIEDITVQGTEQDILNPSGPPAAFTWQSSTGEFRGTINTSKGAYTVLSGHGLPAESKNGAWKMLSPQTARASLWPFYCPSLALFSELRTDAYSFQFVGSETVSGRPAIHIRTSDLSDAVGRISTQQEWFIDPSTLLPLRVEFRLPRAGVNSIETPMAVAFGEFRALNGVLLPYQLSLTIGPASTTAVITTIALNSHPASSTFDPPTGVIQ